MDIKLPHSLLKQYLDTSVTPETIANNLSLCGPTVDRLHTSSNDHVYEIEIITNRVDSASAFGVAREAAAILPEFGHKAELINNPYQNKLADLGDLPKNQPIEVQILDSSLVLRFSAISLTNINIKPSPQQIQDWLTNSDQRPLNNVIDITNELTLKYGQPVHVFDLDKISGKKFILRESKKGEKILTLDGRTHTLRGGDIVIEDGGRNLIDLCGIMGGGLSDVDENTKNILLFVQTYEPKRIRRTSLYTQERTLASQIFEKSPDSELVLPVLIEGVKLLQQRAQAKISSALVDIYPDPPTTKQLQLNLSWLNQYIGIDIPKTKVITILNNLGFTTKSESSDILDVAIPSWRLGDISIKEDLVEEITRVYGYFRLPSILPTTTLPAIKTDPLITHEYTTRQKLVGLGFSEIYNISLVSEDMFKKCELSLDPKLRLSNPLSNEYEYLRTSLIPSLVTDLEQNKGYFIHANTPQRLFELANVYHSNNNELPDEISTLTLATIGEDFLTTKGLLEALAKQIHVELEFRHMTTAHQPFITSQSAAVYTGKSLLGHIGVVDASAFQLDNVVVAELNFAKLSAHIATTHNFTTVPQFASIFEDITLTSDKNVGDLLTSLRSFDSLIREVTYLTSHQNKHTFKVEFNSSKGNLTQETVNEIKTKLQKN